MNAHVSPEHIRQWYTPTGELQWKDGVLEQRWRYQGSFGNEYEWLPVPSVAGALQPTGPGGDR